MNKSAFTYYLLITMYLGILGFVVIGTFIWMTIYFKDAQPVLINLFTVFIISLIAFVHSILILFNFEAWRAKREHQVIKYEQKKIKYLKEHKDLMNILIENDFDYAKLGEYQCIVERLKLKSQVDNMKNKIDDLKNKKSATSE